MELSPDYEEARVEDGIKAFDDVLKPNRSRPILGKIAIKQPPAELPPGIIDDEDEDFTPLPAA